MTSDLKPRLRWTAELHDRFVDAVAQLGGPDRYCVHCGGHSKDHYENHGGERPKFISFEVAYAESCMAENQDTSSSASPSSRAIAKEINDSFQVTEALQVQMEVQRRLHEQLEVQRRPQLRIEAQGKYLQTILEKACKVLNDQAAAAAGLEAARDELSELAIKISHDSHDLAPLYKLKMPSFSDITTTFDSSSKMVPNFPVRIGDCSVDSYLISATGTPASSAGLNAQNAALKKRPRPVSVKSFPFEIMQAVEWMPNS